MKEAEKTSIIKNTAYFLKLLWKISPLYILLEFIIELFSFGVWTFYTVIFTQYLFGDAKTKTFEQVVFFIVAALVITLSHNIILNWYYNLFLPKMEVKCHFQLNTLLFHKAKTVDLSCYENPEFYNTYTKATAEASNRAFSVIEHAAILIGAIASGTYVVVTMAQITPWSLFFIVLPLIGNLYFGKRLGKLNFQINEEATPDRRRMEYVNRVIYFRQYAGELRLTNIHSVLEDMFRASASNEKEIVLKHAGKRAFYDIAKSVLMFLLGYEGMWLCAAVLAVSGQITLGGLAVLLSAIVSVSWMMNDIERALSTMSTNAFFIGNLKSFLEYVPKIDESKPGKTPPEKVETIEFKNVSFKYDGQENFALQNISLRLKKGVRHALVGINGSGKTTLIKLLMRYYDVSEGEILLNGINIKEFDVRQYRGLIGAAFQDFALFSATVSENVLLREPVGEQDRAAAVKALENADIYEKIQALEHKENSVLTKEFDNNGVELSGGEKQKIAIARAFAKNSPIVILDEPSSALDPVAEYTMFETITALCRGENKLSVIVSHRLSSAAMCDKLFVFSEGKLVEQGSHRELLEADGIYADMFYKQARNYTASEVGEA